MPTRNKMTLVELCRQPEWSVLSPGLKKVLTMFFENGAKDLSRVLAIYDPNHMPDEQKAEKILAMPAVQAVLQLYERGIDYEAIRRGLKRSLLRPWRFQGEINVKRTKAKI